MTDDNNYKEIFSAHLKELLRTEGMTQADLMHEMNVSSGTASAWCTGKTIPRIETIQQIANWLGVSTLDLLTPSPSEKDENGEMINVSSDKAKWLLLLAAYASEVDIEDLKVVINLLKRLRKKPSKC